MILSGFFMDLRDRTSSMSRSFFVLLSNVEELNILKSTTKESKREKAWVLQKVWCG